MMHKKTGSQQAINSANARQQLDAPYWWMIIGVVVTGVFVSFGLYQTLRWQQDQLITEGFKHRSAERIKSIVSQFESGVHQVRLVGASMQLAPELREGQFDAIATSLLSEHSQIQALTWNQRITFDEVDAFIATTRQKYPDFKLRRLNAEGEINTFGARSEMAPDSPADMFVVKLLAPLEANRRAHGLDITSEPVRREAVYRACASGKAVASGRIRLVQETASQYGTLVIVPVYRSGIGPGLKVEDRSNVAGVVVGVFRIGDALEAAMANLEPAGIDVHLLDTSASPGDDLLYVHSSRRRTRTLQPIENLRARQNQVSQSSTFEVGGRNWEVICTPTPDYFPNRRTWTPVAVLYVGLFVALLTAMYIYAQGRLSNSLQNEFAVRVASARQLAEKERSLAHISRLSTMGEMVAGIAHEINQPLGAISNFSAAARNVLLAKGQAGHASVDDWLQQIGTQAVRCGDIIRRLRRFVTKDDQGFELVNLNDVVHDSIALVASDPRYPEQGISSHLPDAAPHVFASEVQLQQVLVNLLRNACDSVPEAATAVIHVNVELREDQVRLTVEDNGPGIRDQTRASLFDAFFTTKKDGMGMGLAISKSIIEHHNGTLWLDPDTRDGAKFHVELPGAQL